MFSTYGSSPHTRGYFWDDHQPRPTGRPLPRTRGGISAEHLAFLTETYSSPHTRGYFDDEQIAAATEQLFPAHAGVFPTLATSHTTFTTLPRTRGGISQHVWDQNTAWYSSPHTRGYFQASRIRPHAHALFPAHAGVFPDSY